MDYSWVENGVRCSAPCTCGARWADATHDDRCEMVRMWRAKGDAGEAVSDDMDYPPLSAEDQADVDREWEAYWCALLAPNGALDVERVKREMYAFSMLADDVSKVYMAVTGDKVSKPGTDPDVVIGLAKEHSGTLAQDACEAAIKARREEAEEAADMLREDLLEIDDMLPEPDSPEVPKATEVLRRFCAWRKETVELISRMRAALETTACEEHDAATAWLRRMGR